MAFSRLPLCVARHGCGILSGFNPTSSLAFWLRLVLGHVQDRSGCNPVLGNCAALFRGTAASRLDRHVRVDSSPSLRRFRTYRTYLAGSWSDRETHHVWPSSFHFSC